MDAGVSFGDFAADHAGEFLAVLWDHVEVRPARAIDSVQAAADEDGDAQVALDVFAAGDGDDLDRA